LFESRGIESFTSSLAGSLFGCAPVCVIDHIFGDFFKKGRLGNVLSGLSNNSGNSGDILTGVFFESNDHSVRSCSFEETAADFFDAHSAACGCAAGPLKHSMYEGSFGCVHVGHIRQSYRQAELCSTRRGRVTNDLLRLGFRGRAISSVALGVVEELRVKFALDSLRVGSVRLCTCSALR
jgi:hypothetical protein